MANGWYFRDLAEVLLWRQSEPLVAGEKVWEAGRARDPAFTCAKMFWWYNMYSQRRLDARRRGRCIPPTAARSPTTTPIPPELHDELNAKLGTFPLFKFWGPLRRHHLERWIAEATLHVMATRNPTLTLCYLPHLDYNLQRLGPDLAHPRLQKDLARDRRALRRADRGGGERPGGG